MHAAHYHIFFVSIVLYIIIMPQQGDIGPLIFIWTFIGIITLTLILTNRQRIRRWQNLFNFVQRVDNLADQKERRRNKILDHVEEVERDKQ